MIKHFLILPALFCAMNMAVAQYVDDKEEVETIIPQISLKLPINSLLVRIPAVGMEYEQAIRPKVGFFTRVFYANSTLNQSTDLNDDGKFHKQGFILNPGFKFYMNPTEQTAPNTLFYHLVQLNFSYFIINEEQTFGVNCTGGGGGWWGWPETCDYWRQGEVKIQEINYGLNWHIGVMKTFGKLILDVNGGLGLGRRNNVYLESFMSLDNVRESDITGPYFLMVTPNFFFSVGYIIR